MANTNSCCSDLTQWLPTELFKALSDPNRITILNRLALGKGEQTVSELAECCPIDLSVVSRHLKTLHRVGVVEAQKRGKEVYYQIHVNELVQLLRGLADALESCCPDGKCNIPIETQP